MTLEHIVIAYLVTASMVLILGTIAFSGGDMQASRVAEFDRGYLISRAH